MARDCKHRILQVREENALGVVVDCVRCDETFDLPFENVERFFLNFHHNSPLGPSKDRTLLVNERVFE